MIEMLQRMQRVEEIDTEIRRLDTQRAEHEAAIEQFRNDMAKRDSILARLHQNAMALAQKRAGAELELKTSEGRREKFSKQSMMVRTPKELEAVNHELAGVEAEISRIEEQILLLMDDEEKLGADLKSKTEAASKLAVRAAGEVGRLESLRDEAINMLKGLREDRVVALNQVDEEMRDKYERLLKKPGLPVLAHLKDDACGGCGAILPPHTGVEVRSGTCIDQCPRCLRFLIP